MSTSVFDIIADASHPRNGLATTGPKYMGSGITAELVEITPAMAQAWLDQGNHGNRPVRSLNVRRLAAKIAEGRFTLNHQGIAFDDDGNILDGQHRLMAIVQAGRSAFMFVFRGLPSRSVLGMDEGALRNIPDVFGKLVVGGDVGHDTVAAAKMMYTSTRVNAAYEITDKEFWVKYILSHREALAFAVSTMGGEARHSVFRAIVARAWYTRDRGRLATFGAVTSTGVMTGPEDQAAVILRDFFMKNRKIILHGAAKASFYRKAENALTAFLDGRQIKKLHEAPAELFPIPGEG